MRAEVKDLLYRKVKIYKIIPNITNNKNENGGETEQLNQPGKYPIPFPFHFIYCSTHFGCFMHVDTTVVHTHVCGTSLKAKNQNQN